MKKLLKEVRACTHCQRFLPHKPRPVIHLSEKSQIVIVGQAPGAKVHKSGTPWDDASGDRLREWMGVSREQFYDTDLFAIVPMGFCYPGKAKSGDLPPRPECAPLWMDRVLSSIEDPKMLILVGNYSQKYFLQKKAKENLTETVKNFKAYLPNYFVLPHPSPRNNIWLKKNEWFEERVLPGLRRSLRAVLL